MARRVLIATAAAETPRLVIADEPTPGLDARAAKRVLNTYLHGLSIGIINLINILQPEIICLGGGISNAEDDLLLDPLRQLVDEGTFDKSNPTRLEKASLGNDAGVVGAALLCHMM